MTAYSHTFGGGQNMERLFVMIRGVQLAFVVIISMFEWALRASLARFHFATPSPETTGHFLTVMLERMGPTFIKFGQVLSSRPDLIGNSTARPLAQLRDHISPVPARTIIGIIEESFGAPIEQLFMQFTNEPIASGSVAQVHTAVYKRGQSIAIKVQRPGLRSLMARDFTVLNYIGAFLEWIPGFRSVPFRDVFRELEVAIMSQLDFKREAENNRKFQQNLKKQQHVRIPRLIPELCNHVVITMEYLSNLTPVDATQLSTETRREVAKVGLQTLYHMIFVDGFIHADLHPGNIFFRGNGEMVILDFGLAASLDKEQRQQFSEFFFAMVTNNGSLCARIVQQTAQSIAPGFDQILYLEAMRVMVDRFAGCRVQEFEVARFATELFDLQRRFGIRGSTAFTMTIISLLLFEGILKTLDPEMDFQNEASAFMLTLSTQGLLDHEKRGYVFEALRETWHEHLDKQMQR